MVSEPMAFLSSTLTLTQATVRHRRPPTAASSLSSFAPEASSALSYLPLRLLVLLRIEVPPSSAAASAPDWAILSSPPRAPPPTSSSALLPRPDLLLRRAPLLRRILPGPPLLSSAAPSGSSLGHPRPIRILPEGHRSSAPPSRLDACWTCPYCVTLRSPGDSPCLRLSDVSSA